MAAKSSALRREAPPPFKQTPEISAAKAVSQVDALIHERIRLGIVSALAVTDRLSFKDLKNSLDITDGNLSVHARKLEEAGYIVCHKAFSGRVPKTEYSLTATGKKMLDKYLNHMESLILAMRAGGQSHER